MEGVMVLGVAHSEASNCTSASPSDGLSQMPVDGPVVLNRSPELELGDPMVLDDSPDQGLDKLELVKQCPVVATETVKEVQKQLKRKRASNGQVLDTADKDALTTGCRQELEGLFEYYREVSDHRMQLEGGNLLNSAMVGFLLEESKLAFSKLVEEIYQKLKGPEGVTLASVRNSVLLIGQRVMYGTSNPDADVLEDESEMALWCWEVRDLKLMPVKMRGFFSTRRTARRKIHGRINAIHLTLSVLETPGAETQINDLRKASVKLGKALNLEGIRSMVERLMQKNNVERGVEDVRSTAKESMKDVEKNDQSVGRGNVMNDLELHNGNFPNEKEIQKMQQKVEKEIKRQEKEEAQMRKEQKKLQDEALKEQKRREKEDAEMKKRQKRQEEEALKVQKRREKEEVEMRKQQKRHQEEAEKEQKRREKEASQLKQQLAIQKQATMMERFLKTKKDNEKLGKSGESASGAGSIDLSTNSKGLVSAATSIIDSSFSQQESWDLQDLWRLQVTAWQKLSGYNKYSWWGIRHKPRTEAFKELKLQKTSDDMLEEILSTPSEDTCHKLSQEHEHDKLVDDVGMPPVNEIPCHGANSASLPIRLIKRKLLQFDKSNRPAYYGTWRKKSAVVGPRCPFKMDPDLDYEVDSDDEWEEEDPGESLSDCEKDNDENMEEDSKITDDESEDSFVVPDGYLSDNEGVQVEGLLDDKDVEVSSSPSSQSPEVEEFKTLLRQQKVFNNLTEQALRKSQPLVISNINHEKAELLTAGELKGAAKIEQLCLQVLSMRICSGGTAVDVPIIDSSYANAQEACQSDMKKISTPAAAVSAIPDSDLPEIVMTMRTCGDGINKLVESLQQKFPSVSKSQLKSKVREISDFVDNRWQVKKEILDKLGFNFSPVQPRKSKGIAMYFSKRCLPPEEATNALASSPDPRLKSKTVVQNGNVPECPRINVLPSSQ